jgi:asparagine synthetase B (glutamine-hydrolysing)
MDTPPASMRVWIEGLPIHEGALLTSDDDVFSRLAAHDDFLSFAKGLRGQFAIIVERGSIVTAITDFACTFPIYYLRDQTGAYRTSFVLHDLRSHVSGEISKDALFFYATSGGIGIDPIYAGVKNVMPATVVTFDVEPRQTQYIDWADFLEERPFTQEQAHERFLDIATSYLAALTKNKPVACLLSGGNDSPLVAYLAKQVASDVVCLTSDYRPMRYSEAKQALANAAVLGLRNERILLNQAKAHRAFHAMNTTSVDLPTSHPQLASLYESACWARERDIGLLLNGDQADTVFMGLDGYYLGNLSRDEKLRRLTGWSDVSRTGTEILAAFGCSISECREWIAERIEADREMYEPWLDVTSFTILQQLRGTVWAGVPWQICWLPAQRAAGGVQLVSPFFDIEMIRFALSLPIEFKHRDGITKPLLRDVLRRVAGIEVPRVASPNPVRWWTLIPHLNDALQMDRRVRGLFLKRTAENYLHRGRRYNEVRGLAALGLWLRDHDMRSVA